jgi:hypothetical protein
VSTPHITLTATLLDYSGNTIGTPLQPAWLRIALCGFGATLPVVAGTGNLTKISSWQVDIPFTGTLLSTPLWGNDQIFPAGTYYAISVLDTQKNVLQTGIYQFTGTQTIDLSNAAQIVQPPVPQIFAFQNVALVGTYPGTAFTFPGQVWGGFAPVIFYRGAVQRAGIDYTYNQTTQTVTLNFSATKDGSGNATVYALYIQGLA